MRIGKWVSPLRWHRTGELQLTCVCQTVMSLVTWGYTDINNDLRSTGQLRSLGSVGVTGNRRCHGTFRVNYTLFFYWDFSGRLVIASYIIRIEQLELSCRGEEFPLPFDYFPGFFLLLSQKVCKIGKDVIFDKNMYEIQFHVIKIFCLSGKFPPIFVFCI